MEKINIAFVIDTFDLGGAEKLLLAVVKHLDKSKFRIFAFSLFKGGMLEKDFSLYCEKISHLSLSSNFSVVKCICSLRCLFLKNKIDIVHTHLFASNICGRIAAKLSGIKNVITTLHNPDYSFEDNGKMSYRFRKFVDKFTGCICNKLFLAVSESVKKDFQKNLGFNNIEVLYNSIDTDLYNIKSDSLRKKKREELGFLENDFVLVNIGRLHKQKNQLSLIEAMNFLIHEDKSYKMLIVGSGQMEGILKEKVFRLKLQSDILFLKCRDDIPDILNSCDLFVFPSLYEGFGVALIEAMACGLPVVASGIESLREILEDGLDSVILNKISSEDISKAVSLLRKDKQRMKFLAEKAREKAIKKFDIRNHVANIERIYTNILIN